MDARGCFDRIREINALGGQQRGFQGLGWEGDEFGDDELEDVRGWLFGKAATIYGGSTEIQNNIIAKRVLGLPG